MVTSSSATVGWIATVSSKSRLVAPMLHRDREALQHLVAARADDVEPTTFSSAPATTSFIAAGTLRVVNAWYIGVKRVWYTFTAPTPKRCTASVSVKPTVPIGGWLKMTVGTLS